jgi:large subunit ribosomal protein L46
MCYPFGLAHVVLQAAERGLFAQCGTEMNTWIVSRNPIGVQKPATVTSSPSDVCFLVATRFIYPDCSCRPTPSSTRDTLWPVRSSQI